MADPPPAALQPWLEALRRPRERETTVLRAAMLRDVLAVHEITCVLDVGANRGQSRDFLRDRVGFKGLIASFEPNPAAYRDLEAKAKQDRRWATSNVALGPAAGTRTLIVTENDVMSSFLTPRDQDKQGASAMPVARVEVKMGRLDGVIRTLGEKRKQKRFFLKLDTQGFDLEVMKGLSDRYLDRVPVVMTELAVKRRMYAGAPDFLQSLQYFLKRGYRPAAFFNVISDKRYRAHEMDCLLVR